MNKFVDRLLTIHLFRTFLGDVNLQKLPPGRFQTPWEWKNRVPLEEYSILDVAIPPEDEREHYSYY